MTEIMVTTVLASLVQKPLQIFKVTCQCLYPITAGP